MRLEIATVHVSTNTTSHFTFFSICKIQQRSSHEFVGEGKNFSSTLSGLVLGGLKIKLTKTKIEKKGICFFTDVSLFTCLGMSQKRSENPKRQLDGGAIYHFNKGQ